jgi:hypothetical protein
MFIKTNYHEKIDGRLEEEDAVFEIQRTMASVLRGGASGS